MKVIESACLVAVILLPFLPQVSRILLAAAVLIWLTQKCIKKDFSFAMPKIVWVSYIAFLFLTALSLERMPSERVWTEGIPWVLKWACYLGVFFMSADLFRDAERRRRFPFVFLTTMILVCLNGLYQMAHGSDWIMGYAAEVPGRLVRMRSSFLWPAGLSFFLLFAVPLAFSEWWDEKRWSPRAVLKALVCILFSVCLILTFSRSALLAFIAAIAVMLVPRKSWRFLWLVGLSACFFYLSSPVMRFNFFDSLSWNDITVGERLSFWQGAWGMITAHPLRGSGVGMSLHLQGLYAAVPRADYTHNAYLQIAAELGLPALILFLIPIFFLPARGLRHAGQGAVRGWAVWMGCLAFLFMAFTDSCFYYVQPALLFWMFWGLAAASEAP